MQFVHHKTLLSKITLATIVVLVPVLAWFSFFSRSGAATLTVDTIEQQVETTSAQLQSGITQVDNLQSRTVAALEQTLSVAVDQGLLTSGVSSTSLASPSKLHPNAAEDLVGDAIDQAVSAGTVKLTQITNIAYAPEESIEKMVTVAVNEAVSAGTVSLTQISSIALVEEEDLDRLVSNAIDKAIADGGLALSEVGSMAYIKDDTEDLVRIAVNEAIANGVTVAEWRIPTIISTVTQSLNTKAGPVSVLDLQTAVATQIGGFGIFDGGLEPLIAKMSGNTVQAFESAVKSAIIEGAMSSVTSLAGAVNLTTLQNVIKNQAITIANVEGFLPAINITSSIKTLLESDFDDVVKQVVMQEALAKVGSLVGTTDINAIKTQIANGVISATGLGGIASIAGSLSALTTGAFQEMVKSAMIQEATSVLSGLTSSLSIAGIQNAVAGSLASVGGLGNIATIAASLSTIDVDALTDAIKDSVVQGAIDQLSALGAISLSNVESIIANGIAGITGTGSITAITGAISNTLSGGIASIATISNQLGTLSEQLLAQVFVLDNISALIDQQFATVLSSLTSITTSLTSLQGLATTMLGSITGTLTTTVNSISEIATNVFSTGTLSLAGATSLTSLTSLAGTIIPGLTTSVSTLSTSVSGLTSGVGGIGGGGSTVGYPFGGKITRVRYCRCTGNYAVYFNDLAVPSRTGGLPLIYQPGGTRTYKFYKQTSTGHWILGTFESGGICLRRSGKKCRLIPTAGTMYMVGSSN